MTEEASVPRPSTLGVHAALVLVQVFFGANAVYGKLALHDLSTRGVLGARVLGATLVFVVLRALISRRQGWERLATRALPLVVLSGLLGVSLNQFFFYEGLSRTTATNAAVLMSTIPVFTAGFLVVLGRERPTPARVLGLLVALAGALTVALFGRPQAGAFVLELGGGELFVITNCLCYALYLVVSRPLFQRYRTETAVTWIFLVGAATLGAWCLVPSVRELPHAPPAAILSVVYVLLGPTVGAYFLNGYALRRAPSSLVSVYIYAQPVVAAVLAAFVLHEHITRATLVGGVLIGAGIALTSFGAVRAPPARRVSATVRR